MLPYPESPDDAAVLYHLLRKELERLIVGRADLLRRLAMLGVRHLDRGGSRVVLRGEPGSGKSHVVKALADAVEVQLTTVPLSELAETNWKGRGLWSFMRGASLSTPPWRGIVHLDGLDSLCLRHSMYGAGQSDATRGHFEGKQRSVIQLMARGDVATDDDGKGEVSTEHMTVILTGHLPGLPEHPTAEDYVDAGFIPELAEHLAAATHYRLEPLDGLDMELVLLESIERLKPLEGLFGYDLDVDPSVLHYIARHLEAGLGSLREGISWLEQAAEEAVLSLLHRCAPPGTRKTLAVDDIRIPDAPKGRWAE